MTWIAAADHETYEFSGRGLGKAAPQVADCHSADALITRGSLVIETRVPGSTRPKPLFCYRSIGNWPMSISVQAVPGGGVTLVLDQGGEIVHRTISYSETGRADILRITYSWDAPNRWGQLALERSDQEKALVVQLPDPRPLRLQHAQAMFRPGPDRFLAPDVEFTALSTVIEPVGPMPSLLPDTPILTSNGPRPLREIRRGDLVVSSSGETIPVLNRVSRTVPARGQFAPVCLRAPFFGLQRDITVAPSQRLVLSGSEVEYLFGNEFVLVPVKHLLGGATTYPAACGPLVTYDQLLLPGNEAVHAAGATVESLFIGRIRRSRDQHRASLLELFERSTLPEHARDRFPVLKAFEATVLADHRAA